jgi:hypothetical protein
MESRRGTVNWFHQAAEGREKPQFVARPMLSAIHRSALKGCGRIGGGAHRVLPQQRRQSAHAAWRDARSPCKAVCIQFRAPLNLREDSRWCASLSVTGMLGAVI